MIYTHFYVLVVKGFIIDKLLLHILEIISFAILIFFGHGFQFWNLSLILFCLSVCHHCQNDRQVNSKRTILRTELSNNEGISQIGSSLKDSVGGHAEAFQRKPDLFFKRYPIPLFTLVHFT